MTQVYSPAPTHPPSSQLDGALHWDSFPEEVQTTAISPSWFHMHLSSKYCSFWSPGASQEEEQILPAACYMGSMGL